MNLEINLTSIILFFVGLLLGALILLIYYFINVLICKHQSLLEKAKFSDEEIESLKEKAKNNKIEIEKEFKTEISESKDKVFSIYLSKVFKLIHDTAMLFYPNSKRPLGELTIKEVLKLDILIINDLEEFLPAFVNKKINSMKISKFTIKKEKKKNIFSKVTNIIKKPINFAIKKVTNHFLVVSFGFIVQETFKIYSGKAFDFYSHEEIENEKNSLIQEN